MRTESRITVKRMYESPEIVSIELDSDISLALESSPPFGPGEEASFAPELFVMDVFTTISF